MSNLNDKGKNERIEYNNSLFNKIIFYWILFVSVSLFIFIIYQLVSFYLYKKNRLKKVDSISNLTIEMIETTHLNPIIQLEDAITNKKEKKIDKMLLTLNIKH